MSQKKQRELPLKGRIRRERMRQKDHRELILLMAELIQEAKGGKRWKK